MASNAPENSGGVDIDRLVGQEDVPASPMVGGQPDPGLERDRGHVYTPAELAVMHDRNEAHQLRCAALLSDLTAFCAAPGRENFDEDAYNALCQITGCNLEPVAVMISHGAAVRRQLEEFTASQRELQARLAQAERERDSLKSAADIAERIRQVGLQTSFNEGFTFSHPSIRMATPGSAMSFGAASATSATSTTSVAPVTSVMI
jgi:hypothetical protein